MPSEDPRAKGKSALIRDSLAGGGIHEDWTRSFLTPESEAFYEAGADHIAAHLHARPGETILDAGCGNGHQSIRLARRGFVVQGIDFSPNRVDVARANVAAAGLSARVSVTQQDLTALTFASASFPYILCWGVLMHIPDIRSALVELVRVLKPGGLLVVGENNMHSLDLFILWLTRKLRGREAALGKTKEFGREVWGETSSGPLLIRTADIGQIISFLELQGLKLRERRARQYTEMFLRVRSPVVRKILHRFNNFWFRWIGLPQFAYGNLLIFQKNSSE